MKKALVIFALSLALGSINFTQAGAVQSQQTNASMSVECAPGEAPSGDLGFSGTECHDCSMSGKHVVGEPDIEFSGEPILSGIRKGGPADGKLEERDALVAIDGQPITTRAAAIHLSWLKPEEPVHLTVRRNGVLTDVEITPAARCRRVTSTSLPTIIGVRAPMQRRRLSTFGSRGWLGLSLNCRDCGLLLSPQTAMPFHTFPEVVQVAPDGPAGEAGIKAGDVLIAINGQSLKTQVGASLFRDIQPHQSVTILLIRDAEPLTVTLTAGAAR